MGISIRRRRENSLCGKRGEDAEVCLEEDTSSRGRSTGCVMKNGSMFRDVHLRGEHGEEGSAGQFGPAQKRNLRYRHEDPKL